MLKVYAKWLAAAGVTVFMLSTLLYGLLLAFSVRPLSGNEGNPRPTARRRPLVIAHRGGAGLWPENTMQAFTGAHDLRVDVLEMDVQATADNVLVVMHDATLERTTNRSGPVNRLTLAQLKKLDAGFNFSTDGGRTFPFRGRAVTVPTLEEVFKAFPTMRFNIEPKQAQPSIIKPLCRMIRDHGLEKRVMVGSFSQHVLDEFRAECSEVSTSASTAEVGNFLTRLAAAAPPERAPTNSDRMQALQVPEYMLGRRALTREFVEAAHTLKLEVHAWTINDEESMRRLIEVGVDGIMTDYPDRLITLLDKD
jgi:glycerophosphoryl diester phosphodiesterase